MAQFQHFKISIYHIMYVWKCIWFAFFFFNFLSVFILFHQMRSVLFALCHCYHFCPSTWTITSDTKAVWHTRHALLMSFGLYLKTWLKSLHHRLVPFAPCPIQLPKNCCPWESNQFESIFEISLRILLLIDLKSLIYGWVKGVLEDWPLALNTRIIPCSPSEAV